METQQRPGISYLWNVQDYHSAAEECKGAQRSTFPVKYETGSVLNVFTSCLVILVWQELVLVRTSNAAEGFKWKCKEWHSEILNFI